MKKILLTIALALGISTCISVTSYAGDINSNEARVLAVASGTFTYDGGIYKAKDSYVAQLSAKLSSDGTDLNANQADAAIRLINRNVKRAIDSGYIYRIGDAQSTDTSKDNPDSSANPDDDTNSKDTPGDNPDATVTPGNKDNNESQAPEPTNAEEPDNKGDASVKPGDKPDTTNKPGDASIKQNDNNSDNSSKDPQGTTNPDSDNKDDNQTESKSGNSGTTSFDSATGAEDAQYQNDTNKANREEIIENRPDKDDASGSISFDENKNEIIINVKDNSSDGEKKAVLSKDKDKTINSLKNYFSKYKSILNIIEVILLVITCICISILFIFKCFSFQKKIKPHYGNHKVRRKLRRSLGAILIFVTAINLFVVILSTGVYVGMFQNSKVSQTLSASGYYHDSYKDLLNKVQKILDDNGVQSDVCNDMITYDEYLFSTRNVLQVSLEGRNVTDKYTDIKEEISLAINVSSDLSNEKTDEIATKISEVYQNYVNNIIGNVIYSTRQAFGDTVILGIIIALVNIVISFICMMYMDHYKHRGVRKLAHSIFVGSAAIIALVICIFIFKPYKMMYIEPDYLYISFVTYFKYVAKIVGLIAVSGVIVSIFVQCLAKFLKNGLNQE